MPHQVEAWRAELLDGRERELHLPFDPDRAHDGEIGTSLGRVIEQRGLADARLSVHRQHLAMALSRRREHAVERTKLALPSQKLHRRFPRDHAESMPPRLGYGLR